VSGFRCQENTEDSAQKTDDSGKKADCFPPSVICLLTPETKDIVLFKNAAEKKYTTPFLQYFCGT
jgi:hypothetical protein